ncbi:MAG: hypothetical protein HY318_11370 [Armatimonadetes bacterium]|nr:hypothetical protein [Armatimonadota bacterium]
MALQKRLWTMVLGLVVTTGNASFAGLLPQPGGQVTVYPPPARQSIKRKVPRARVTGGYVVVVSHATFENEQWQGVAQALAFKYRAESLVFDGSVSAVRTELARRVPRYVCFIAQPEEAGRQFVVDVHRMTRKLDDDPYTDVLWGILTGYTAAEAATIVSLSQPLIIRKGAGGTAIPLDVFEEGVWYDEGRKNHKVEKTRDGKTEDKQCPDDTTKDLVDVFNEFNPDLFMTSGHATERDWQIGYSYRNGQFRCKEGVLLGVDTQGKEYAIHSPKPKVYLPIGNCLMGHIKDRESMALAFMGSGGVAQMIGYTVVTWYGRMGWGILDYFLGQPGRFTFAESFYLNNQALVCQLEERFPDKARLEFDRWDEKAPGWIAGQLGYQEWNEAVKDNVGLLWDRDTVAFYGDPAWVTSIATRSLPWEQKLTDKRGLYTFELVANQDTNPGCPPAALFRHRVRDVEVLEGRELKPVITDNFVMLPGLTHLAAGKTYRVVFRATKMPPKDKH